MSAARAYRRRQRERHAERARGAGVAPDALLRAYDRASAGAATEHVPATPADVAARNAVFERCSAVIAQRIEMAAGADVAIVLITPDADDLALWRESAKVERARGDAAGADRLEAMAHGGPIILTRPRRDVLAELAVCPGWADIGLLRHPPTGSVPLVYDGTVTGHGVVAVMRAPLARGGVS